jgi:hypothetical protein
MPEYFQPDDRVVWSHQLGATHAPGSILRADAVPTGAPLGRVVGPDNEAGTHFKVRLDDETDQVLTFEELVKVAGD